MHNYSFYFNDNTHTEHTVGMQISISEGDTWCKVLESFLNFLETVYGYPIKEGVLYLDEVPDIHPSRTVTAHLDNKDMQDPFTS